MIDLMAGDDVTSRFQMPNYTKPSINYFSFNQEEDGFPYIFSCPCFYVLYKAYLENSMAVIATNTIGRDNRSESKEDSRSLKFFHEDPSADN